MGRREERKRGLDSAFAAGADRHCGRLCRSSRERRNGGIRPRIAPPLRIAGQAERPGSPRRRGHPPPLAASDDHDHYDDHAASDHHYDQPTEAEDEAASHDHDNNGASDDNHHDDAAKANDDHNHDDYPVVSPDAVPQLPDDVHTGRPHDQRGPRDADFRRHAVGREGDHFHRQPRLHARLGESGDERFRCGVHDLLVPDGRPTTGLHCSRGRGQRVCLSVKSVTPPW